jgi:predicted flap endonuclease-1-like 5' DNA nuclease/FtsZ-binding cell division protein ZapB
MFEQQVNLGPGTGTFTQHTFEILVMLLGAFLFGLWLGWMLWNRYKQEADKLRLDIQSLTATTNTLTNEINGLKAKLAGVDNENAGLRAQTERLSEENHLLREKLATANEDLSETEYRNRQLETELGLSFAAEPSTPETIPLEINQMPEIPAEEAPLPSEEMPEVVVVETQQIEITIEPAPPLEEKPQDAVATPAVEVIAPQSEKPSVVVAVGDEKDDLTVIEGIGPKIQELLYQYGVRTYHQLADTDVVRLKEILSEAGPQLAMHDPGTWPSQANLAANDQWEALKSIQGFLKGGKKPT